MGSWWFLLLGIPLLFVVGYWRDRQRGGVEKARRTLLWHCIVLAALYVTILVALIHWEDRLVYKPIPFENLRVPPKGLRYEEVTITGPQDSGIKAWWCPCEGASWTVLLSHGSGGNLSFHTYLV